MPAHEHKCPAMEKALKVEPEGYGLAVTSIFRSKDGIWRGYNGEYDVVFAFCPWCGTELTKQGTK